MTERLRSTPGKRVGCNSLAGSIPVLSSIAVLDGALAVPCDLQSAIVGSNTFLRDLEVELLLASTDEG